jgi:hypothetical protein
VGSSAASSAGRPAPYVSVGAASHIVDGKQVAFDWRVHVDALDGEDGTALVAGTSIAFIGGVAEIGGVLTYLLLWPM